MLVVHPASICDVCLDPYSITTEPANSPHVIACGHIFCLTCLRNLSPNACPLCRKSFQPDRIKKLHVAAPPELDGASEEAETAQALSFLQRVALVSRENAPDADVADVLTEVDQWLSEHSEDPNSNLPLRAAVISLRRFKVLQDQTERDKVEHRQLRHQLKHSRRNADHDLKTSRAVEESLLTRIQELEQDHALELSRLHAQLESLQNTRDTHSQYRNTSNPLPQPPEPLPSHRLPPFLRPGAAANGSDSLLDTASYPPHSNPNGNLPNGTYPARLEPAGISHTHVHITQPVAPRPTRGEAPRLDQRNRMPSAQESGYQQDRRSRSGSTHSEFVDRPASRRETGGGSRGSIVRTASPPGRVIISSPSWSRHPLIEERRSDEERETAHRRGTSDGPISRRSVSGESAVPDMDTRMASAAAYIYGYGNGLNSGYRVVNEPRPHTPSSRLAAPSRAQGPRGFPVHESPEAGTNGLGLTGVPPRGPMGSVISSSEDNDATPMNRAVRLGRRHTTQAAGRERSVHGLGDNSLLDPPPHGATRRPHGQSTDQNTGPSRGSTALDGTNGTDTALPRRRRTSIIQHPLDDEEEDESPRSETTWGTVPSASAGNSLSDLGMLLGLHNGGVRGQGSGATSSTAGQNGVDGNITSEGRVGSEPDGESGTPTLPGAFSAAPIGTSALGLITEDEGEYVRSDTAGAVRQPRRTVSYSATTTQVAQAGHDRASRHGRRAERNRDHRRHASQPTSTEVLPTQESGNMSNALSLTFDASPPPHDTYNVSVPSTYSGTGREIFAPTPVFGGPNIIHLWSNRS